MEQSDPPQPGPDPGAEEHDDPRDALRRLEDRLDRASAAAERLIAQAGAEAAARVTGAARGPVRPPPAGWQTPEEARPEGAAAAGDIELLSQVVRSIRDLIPPDLERRLAEALRELLLAMRALIDWWVDRLDRGRPEPAEVEDIPIV
jgi:hypothetical protein